MSESTKYMRVAFTGPREFDENLEPRLIMLLTELADEARSNGAVLVAVSGGAQGFDEQAVHACAGLNIPVFIMFPNTSYPNYYWLGGDKNEPQGERLEAMLEAAKQSGGGTVPEPCGNQIYVKDRDGNRIHANFARNFRMVHPSDVVVVGTNGRPAAMRSPGTSHAVQYAESISKRVVYLNDPQAPAVDPTADWNPWA
jgi:hypothetical protein